MMKGKRNCVLKRALVMLAVSMVFIAGIAVPARIVPVTAQQPDGTTLTFYVQGDEMSHWLQTDDGILLVQGDDGAYYYARTDADGLLVSSGMLAHNASGRSEEELAFIKANKESAVNGVEDIIKKAETRRVQQRQSMPSARAASIENIRGPHLVGKRKELVILVEFDDMDMTTADVQSVFDAQFNQKGYNRTGHMGSVHDYFYDQSYGQLDISFDVVGPVKVSRETAYYGKNDAYGNDRRPGQMVAEACRLVDGEVDFSQYDNDGDGYVDQVSVIYAGYSESASGVSSQIWAHQSTLYDRKHYASDGDGVLTLDGVKVNRYSCSSELYSPACPVVNPIGMFCHEYSHCLGLMDVYDVKYSGGFNMQDYDVMSLGCYGGIIGIGEAPCGYTAYERWYLGWLDFIELKDAVSVKNMPSLGDAPVAYIIYNENTSSEFFTLENRQDKGWFSYVGSYADCHGMLITHFDYDAKAWNDNTINTSKNHQRISYVPADNNYGTLKVDQNGRYYYSLGIEDVQGDLFPGLYNVTSFTDDTHASCGGSLFHLNTNGTRKLGKPITNITENDGLISFDVCGGSEKNVYDAISDVDAVGADIAKVIYDASGKVVDDMSAPGIYVVKENGTVRKVVVR